MTVELTGVAILAILQSTGAIDIHYGWIFGIPFLITFTEGFIRGFVERVTQRN